MAGRKQRPVHNLTPVVETAAMLKQRYSQAAVSQVKSGCHQDELFLTIQKARADTG
jgi:hypothetical protein